MDPYLLNHRGHDYETLMKRWRKIQLHQTELSIEGGFPVLLFENEAGRNREENGLYLSAGVHGDECAPVWALLEWTEKNSTLLSESDLPLTVFPCLNPHGLTENRRYDQRDQDLNRLFQDAAHSLIGPWQQFMEGRKFRLAANLHEDYDSCGIYLYQLPSGKFQPGEQILMGCQNIIPREVRSIVDGSPFKNGLATRSGDMRALVESRLDGGYPEAIWLYLHHLSEGGCALTFETPSEFSLTDRVKAHSRFLDGVLAAMAPQHGSTGSGQ